MSFSKAFTHILLGTFCGRFFKDLISDQIKPLGLASNVGSD
jgi:hypothetical protein